MALSFPPIYLLPTHLSPEERQELESRILTLTHDVTEANIILGKVATKQRAQFELRCRKLWTEEVVRGNLIVDQPKTEPHSTPERRRVSIEDGKGVGPIDSSTESEVEVEAEAEATEVKVHPSLGNKESRDTSPPTPGTPPPIVSSPISLDTQITPKPMLDERIKWGDTVRVVKLPWFDECLAAGCLVPFGNHLVYEGRPTRRIISARQILAKVRHVPSHID
jgi:DNA polymerase IV